MGELPGDILGLDVTEIDGFDNLHQAEGILRRLQEEANELYRAGETFYLINGSTVGILSAVSAVLPEGGHLLMARNCHKSVYHAAYLRKLKLSYLYPARVQGFEFCEAVTAGQVEQALEREPDIGAVLIVSPTYEGRIADVREIARVVHGKGLPLIVDEAHGAHLGFAKGFAPGSCTEGADLVIHSVHKTLPALTQTALLHVNGSLVDRERLRRFLHIYQTSSPSYLLMASIEDAMEAVRQGQERFDWFSARYRRMLTNLRECRVLRLAPWRDVERGRQDIGKLVIAADRAGMSGQWLYDELRDKYHLQCEMSAGAYCLAMFTMADDEEAYTRMERALIQIDRELAEKMSQWTDSVRPRRVFSPPKIAYSLAEAWDMPYKMTRLSDSIDCPVAEFINLYPPGIPLLAPGEVMTEELCGEIMESRAQGLNVQGIEEREGDCFVKAIKKDRSLGV